MDVNRVHPRVRSLTSLPSRRDVLKGLVGAGFGLTAPADWPFAASDVEAKKKRKRKRNKNKPQPPPPPVNAFGCLDVGQACRGDSALCCSGICDPGTATCLAHNAGICFVDADLCTLQRQVKCNPSNPSCTCLKTTGNAGFCGDFTKLDKSCRLCSSDTDCQAEFGAGAACVVLGGICTEVCAATGRTACVRPCA